MPLTPAEHQEKDKKGETKVLNLPFKVDLSGKVAVVTGAGGVLCSVFAEALAMCGAKVAMLNRSYERVSIHAGAINSDGYTAKVYVCDVLDAPSVRAAHEAVLKDFGPADILINGAGGNNPKATTDDEFFESKNLGEMKTFFDLEMDDIGSVFSLNYLGSLIPTQIFAKDMLDRQGCCIVNISSMNSYTPLTKVLAYSGAKAAVSNLTQWMATYFAKTGIRCNAIAPGFFSTKQNAELLFRPDGTPTPRTGKILASTPMGRFGKPEELIGALLFLVCEEASSFVNGAVIPVDGAYNAYSGV